MNSLMSRFPLSAACTLLAVFVGAAGCRSKQIASTYRYDREGRLTGIATPDNRKIEFQYDDHGLLRAAAYGGGRVQYTYDGNGNRIWMQDSGGSTQHFYDAFDRLSAVYWQRGGRGLVAYEHGPAGRISRVSYFSLKGGQSAVFSRFLPEDPASAGDWGQRERALLGVLRSGTPQPDYSISLFHDVLGRVTLVQTPGGPVTYEYLPKSRQVQRKYPNGIASLFTYNAAGQMASVRHGKGDGALLQEYRYEHDRAGRVAKVVETGPAGQQRNSGLEWTTGGYLAAYVDAGGRRTEFEYDAMGNRIRSTSPDRVTTYTYL